MAALELIGALILFWLMDEYGGRLTRMRGEDSARAPTMRAHRLAFKDLTDEVSGENYSIDEVSEDRLKGLRLLASEIYGKKQ